MRVIVGLDRYAIHFRHLFDGKRHETVCHVVRERPDLSEIVAMGTARCNPHDTFSKALGRDLAFKRAMQFSTLAGGLSRATRTAVWRAYRQRGCITSWPTSVALAEREAHASSR